MRRRKTRRRTKPNNAIKLSMIILLIIVLTFAIQKTWSKYVIRNTQIHSQESTSFYFESDIAIVNGKTSTIKTSSSSFASTINFYVRNYDNDSLYTSKDISYTINVTADSGLSVILADSSRNTISDSDTLTLSGGALSNNTYTISVTGSSNEATTKNVYLTIASSSPYTKTLTATIAISNTVTSENEVTLEESTNAEYVTLSITANVSDTVTVTYDTSKLMVDENTKGSNMTESTTGTITITPTIGETYNIIFIKKDSTDEIVLDTDIVVK